MTPNFERDAREIVDKAKLHGASDCYLCDVCMERITTSLRKMYERGVSDSAAVAENPGNLNWIGGSTGNAQGTAYLIALAIRNLVKENTP